MEALVMPHSSGASHDRIADDVYLLHPVPFDRVGASSTDGMSDRTVRTDHHAVLAEHPDNCGHLASPNTLFSLISGYAL